MTGVSRPTTDTVGDGGRSYGVSLGDSRDVHPIEGGQVIEMDDMIMQSVRDENQVSDVLRIRRNIELKGVLNGAH
jgi:hypothetical protein